MNKLVKAITVFGLTAAMALPFAACGEGGKSAYDIAVDNGFVGTEEEWLESLVGPQGPQGEPGQDGEDGQDGAPGADGTDGATPTIEINEDGYWVINGVVTDVKAEGQDGEDGKDGQDGQDGQDGEDGKDGQDGQDGQDGEDGKDGQDGTPGKPGQDGAPGKPGVGIESITSAIKTENGTSYTVITITLTDGTKQVFNLPGVATTPGASYETGDASVFAELYNAGAGEIKLTENVTLTAEDTLNAVTGNITIDLAGKTLNLGNAELKTSGVGTITVTGAGKIVGQDPSLGIGGQGTLLDDGYVSVKGAVAAAEEGTDASTPAVLAETSETTYTIFAEADLPAEYTVIAGTAAFKTLDEAIAAVNANQKAYTNDDTLIVTVRANQTLSAAVTLSRDDMTIAGETADTKVAVALNGEGEQAGIYINANNITISDLALTLTGGNGDTAVIKPLWAEDGAQVADLKLSNLTITGNDAGHGINLHNVKDAVVENCTISSYGKNGIAIASATGVTINGVTFKDTTAWADIGLMYAGNDNKTTTAIAGEWYKTPVTGVKIGDNTYAIGNLYSDITHAFAEKVYGAEVAADAYDFTFTGAYDFNALVYVKADKADIQQYYVTDAVLAALPYEAIVGDTYYALLEDALADVNADTTASPVTVEIAAGEYTLNAYTISRANVTFVGAGVYTAAEGETAATGTKLTFTATNGDQAGLYIAANDVTVSYMTIAVTGGTGNTAAIKPVWAADAQVANLTLSNLTIIGNEQGHGVNLHNVKDAVVENCTIENYKKVGIAVASATGVTITGVTFTEAEAWGDIGLMYADSENGTSGTTPGDWYKTPVTGVALGEGNVFAAKLLYSDITPDFAKTVYGNKTGIYDISGMSAYDLDPIIFHKADGSVQKWYVDADVLAAKKPAAAIGNHYYETLETALADLEEGDTLTLMAGEYAAITLPDLADITVVGAGADKTTIKGGIWFGYNLTNTADKLDDQVSWTLKNLTVDGDYTSNDAAIVGVDGNVHVAGVGSTFALSNVVIKNAKWGFQVASDAKNIAVTFNNVQFETLGCAISMKTGENDPETYTKNGNTYTVTNCTFTDVDYQLQEFYPNNYYETIGGEATDGSGVTVQAPTKPADETTQGGDTEE